VSSTEARRQAAARYISRGVAVIPVPAGEKNPRRTGWETLRITEEEIPNYWTNGQNIGLLCGEPSDGRVDVDLDSEEAVSIAGRFLPPTLTSGRKGRPHSHWWYVSPGAKSCDWKDTLDADSIKKLVELRSTGRQTLVAPSTHPDGDEYVWHTETGLKMAEIAAPELTRSLRELATAVLIARHLPPIRTGTEGGGRHDYALALAGFLLRSGRFGEDLTLKVLKASWDARGWPGETDKREAYRDLEGIVRDTAENLAAGEPVVGGPTLEEMAPGVLRLLCKWWGWERKAQTEDKPEEKEERKLTQAEQLIDCATGVELFHSSDGDSYATIPVGGHKETHPIKSKGFRHWLVRAFFERYERPPGAQALQEALGLLEARAQFDGAEWEVHVQVAEHNGAIYVDLANDRWEAVEITTDGWRVVSSEATPVRTRRPRGMLALPVPKRGGTVDELKQFVNVSDYDSWRLLVAWLVQALGPRGPYPVMLLQGEQGSAKSTAERLLRALVDPSAAPLRTTPRNEHDLYIAATNAWVIALDNISNLQPWLSDGLCRLSTGGGFSTRTLYENREQELFDATRPLVLNGITDVATRPDLLDRALIVGLPPIPEDERRPEGELWAAFEKARPSILGALFDAVAGALKTVSSLRLERIPRMADFALWATAAESALGWKSGAFIDAYTGNRREATESALEADPVAGAVRALMQNQEQWNGTATELWQILNELVDEDVRHTKAWPAAPNSLTSRLKRLAPALRGIGIEYSEERTGRKGSRLKKLTKKVPAKDRQYRQDRQPPEGILQNEEKQTDNADGSSDGTDGTYAEDRQYESPANRGFTDGSDGTDDDQRKDSKEDGSWQGDPMRHYGRGGMA
jgi:hypothetical protein